MSEQNIDNVIGKVIEKVIINNDADDYIVIKFTDGTLIKFQSTSDVYSGIKIEFNE